MASGRKAFQKARSAKRRFDAWVRTTAWYVGWAGVALLVAVAVLYMAPASAWDGRWGLREAHLPAYLMAGVLMASMVGWSFINVGEDRIKKHLGKHVNLVLFVVLPLCCAAAGLLSGPIARATGWQKPEHAFWLVVFWYPALLVMVCAAAFLTWKARPRKRVYLDRGANAALLMLPYAALFAYIVLGVHVDWLDDNLQETMNALGAYALVLQLVLAYFVGGD